MSLNISLIFKSVRRIYAVIFLLTAIYGSAQSIWSRQHLEQVKTELERPTYSEAYRSLITAADSLLHVEPMTVMMKKEAGASGDKHDYTSLARYFHRNPTSPDGLPYIERDGISNPEINDWDRNRFGETTERIKTLSLAWYFSGDERYAAKATGLLDAWFLNKETRMNPQFEYAQMIPGVNGGKGRSFGVLDGYSIVGMLDGVALLDGSSSWDKTKERELKTWMNALLDWLLTSEQGMEESRQANNHSTVYDVLTASIAMYVGREDIAREIMVSFPKKRIFAQINPDGSQPHEMWRTLSYGYSQYNLSHMTDIFLMARKLGIRIDDAESPDGRSFYKAMDNLASFLGKPVDEWPGKQIAEWNERQQRVTRDLWRIACCLDTTRTDYKSLYRRHRIFDPADCFTLLYYTPDATDDVFSLACQSLRHAIARTEEERKKPGNVAERKLSPRSIDKNGILTLVHPHDWTSGFFPGELWMMYEYTNDPFWKRWADTYTRDIEEAKTHAGTHDLGFMIGDSFGKAWELTGNKYYLNVVEEASNTLCTRFNPAVGAIRSWDHNSEVWHYPVIIDNMMNLEMLFNTAETTGNTRFRNIAISHADVTLRNHFRPDGSSYHVVDYDPSSGDVRMKITAQGYSDNSFWSRGQAWAIYGYTMCYRYTKEQRYLSKATEVADWFLSLPNMPEDNIPYWDMKAPGAEERNNGIVPRDASAAAIIASGLYELSEYTDASKGSYYRDTADKILYNLIAGYMAAPCECEGFLLKHSTGHYPAGSEIDVPLVYADYYFLEALVRKQKLAALQR